jgi:DNA repair protein RecO (recombination protein O)
MKLLKTDGIVIKKIDHSEADRVLTIFTKNFGKININVNGIRKSKKRHLNGADLFGISSFIFYKKEDYYVLSSFELIETFTNLATDLEKVNISFHILEILNNILVENTTRMGLYNTLLKSLKFLEKNTIPEKNLLLLGYFLILIIKEEGIIFSVENGRYFDFDKSRISSLKTSWRLTPKEKDIITYLIDGKIELIMGLDPEKIELKNIIRILEEYLNYHINSNLKFNELF